MKIWMCENLDSIYSHTYGKTKAKAEYYMCREYGYQDFKEVIDDDWCKEAVQVEVPLQVRNSLIVYMESKYA